MNNKKTVLISTVTLLGFFWINFYTCVLKKKKLLHVVLQSKHYADFYIQDADNCHVFDVPLALCFHRHHLFSLSACLLIQHWDARFEDLRKDDYLYLIECRFDVINCVSYIVGNLTSVSILNILLHTSFISFMAFCLHWTFNAHWVCLYRYSSSL